MLRGLEVSEIRLSELENEDTIGAEYYAPEYLVPFQTLLRSSYKKLTLKKVCTKITDGDHGSAEYSEKGIPFVLSEAVREGWIENNACRFITISYSKTLERSRLRAGDVLVTKTGVYFGKSAVVSEEFDGANTIAHVGILRPRKGMCSYFLSTFVNSKYGYSQFRRRGIKATRPEIKLIEFHEIQVPILSKGFQEAVKETVLRALEERDLSENLYSGAEQALLGALGLDNWYYPEPLTYTRMASETFTAGRLDSQYFSPRVQTLIQILSRDGLTVGDVAQLRKQYFNPLRHETFEYLEIGGVTASGEVNSSTVPSEETPDRATWYVRSGDVITSTVRPIRRLSALIYPEQEGFVCSSGFAVLEPSQVPGELLLVFLRLPVIAQLMDLHTTASMYPAISIPDILKLPFVQPSADVAKEIAKCVRDSHAARKQAHSLLERAKRGVEIAIEENEAAGLNFLQNGG